MPKLRHYDHLNTARFITFCCYRRHQFLVQPSVCHVLIEWLEQIRRQHEIKILGYVLMPEHVHFVLHPPDTVKLGPVIGQFKSKTASAIISRQLLNLPPDSIIRKEGRERHAFWQPRCYDHNCRSPETVLEKISYCHMNPVKRGLVKEPGEWRWSSYNWYEGRQNVSITMDVFDGSNLS